MQKVTDERNESYYVVRAFVRMVFWSTVIGVPAFLAFHLGASDTEYCDVTVHRNFTWTPNNGSLPSLNSCEHPSMIVLQHDGTWVWGS